MRGNSVLLQNTHILYTKNYQPEFFESPVTTKPKRERELTPGPKSVGKPPDKRVHGARLTSNPSDCFIDHRVNAQLQPVLFSPS